MIVFDLDGTLCDGTLARLISERPGTNWVEKRHLIKDVKRNWPVVEMFRAIMFAPGSNVAIWTGRPREVQEETEAWLTEHVFMSDLWERGSPLMRCGLRMRERGDVRPDAEIKAGWLAEVLAAGGEVSLAVDDRQRVVDMWRARGVICAQVQKGDY